MLMLLFNVGEQRFALESVSIVEVIPRVQLRPIIHAKDYLAGMLDFHGVPVPVVDFCRLIAGRPALNRLHTRIIVIKFPLSGENSHLFGLAAENVTEVTRSKRKDFIDAGMRVSDVPYLGGIMTDEEGVVQLVLLDKLYAMLYPELFVEDL